ncbi:protein roadkill-like isoform X2 [Odontomachus brunneus]|nr:protein roadkill-like isoform X2 [Odontomachus brunneus]XP_032665406.1 protein roadkill-like isoform X2 [Odontomachus brunneus]XP_032665408.1 protein roadkill-like isoform X2 [Odontomachus brunneus]XP_032665409.1 protein roadkill-like isoform X2 [Odontomachus brunneus]
MRPIYTDYIESQDVQFELNFDSTKQNLNLYLLSHQKYTGICRVFLKNNELNFYKTVNKVDVANSAICLCSIPIIILVKNTTECVPNNILTIYIECKWHNGISKKTMCTKISQDYLKLSKDTKEAVHDKESVVTFIIGDERLYVNKNLICAKSSVFQAMFSSEMKEGISNEVKITDVKYDILKLLLSYIQFCFIADLNVKDVQMLYDLFMAADKYDVQDLKMLCEVHLINLINTENCIEILTKICLNNTKYLEKYILEYIQIQPKCVFKQELIKLIETNSISLLYLMKYTEIQTVLHCDTETYSTIIGQTRKITKENQE